MAGSRCQDDDEPSTPPVAPRPRSKNEDLVIRLGNAVIAVNTMAVHLESAIVALRTAADAARTAAGELLELKDELAARG